MSKKIISISLSPNVENDDIQLAKEVLKNDKDWQKGEALENLEENFSKLLRVEQCFLFNSGRSALDTILKSLDLSEGSEALLQAFTCEAAVAPFIWNEIKPVYVDVDPYTFNFSVEDARRKITPRTKLLMIQHTFGVPADMEAMMNFASEYNLIVIEDCAHSLGAKVKYKGEKKLTGTIGDFAFFSFGRDKVISSVYGGAALQNKNEKIKNKKLEEIYKGLDFPNRKWIKQQLKHPIWMEVVLKNYSSWGKYLLVFFQKIGFFSKAVTQKEKIGKKPDYFSKKLPNVLATLADSQLEKLDRFNAHRKNIAIIYDKILSDVAELELPKNNSGIYLRYTVKTEKAHDIIRNFWKEGILIGDWYTSVVAPKDTDLEKFYYKKGSCPVAEKLARTTLNLPTHINISEEDARMIAEKVRTYVRKCI